MYNMLCCLTKLVGIRTWPHNLHLIFGRCIGTAADKSGYFITTPIFYVNAAPHVGHLYTALLSDAQWRFQNLLNSDCHIFSTGTDEHGLKVQIAAKNCSVNPSVFCDDVSSKFKTLFDKVGINYTHFVRTTEDRHRHSVEVFFNNLKMNDKIYLGKYSGWYSIQDESFLTESQVEERKLPSGEVIFVSSESGHTVEWNSEKNYMFKLSEMQSDLIYWLESSQTMVSPNIFYKLLHHWLSENLYDLSVSRPSSRVSWGISVPGDSDHILYVWLDALVNYLTVAGYPDLTCWPPDVQVIGKDILKFHGIYWPAMLIACGLEPPRHLFVHSHWTFQGQKMSKSKGNIVDPGKYISMFTVDGFRYTLLRNSTSHSDSSWNEDSFIKLLNSELADSFGNLISRSMSPSLNPDFMFPELSVSYLIDNDIAHNLIDHLYSLPDIVANHYRGFNFYLGIQSIIDALHKTNEFFHHQAPWLLKNEQSNEKLNSILHIAFSSVRSSAIMLQPITPFLSSQVLDALNVPVSQRKWSNINDLPSVNFVSRKLKSKIILFSKIKK